MSDRLRRGAFLRHADATWQIKLFKAGILHLENAETGETDRLTLDEYQTGCYNGDIEPLRHDGAGVPEEKQALLKVALKDMPPKMAVSAMHKDFYISAFENPRAFWQKHFPEEPVENWLLRPLKSRSFINRFTRAAHDAFVQHELPVLHQRFEAMLEVEQRRIGKLLPAQARRFPVHIAQAPGPSTYIGWLSAWEASANQDKRLLASRYSDRGPSTRTMNPLLEEWLDEEIDTCWLQDTKPKKVVVFRNLGRRVRRWNREHPDRPVLMIGQRHVSRYMSEEVNLETIVRRREGDEAADQRFKQVGETPEPEHILEVVEVDHTRGDIDVLEDQTLKKLGRPWVTTALDRRSRMPVGLHVHFDGPSIGAVMQCLRNAMMPKDFLQTLCPGIDYPYPAHGVMEALLFDRGSDFDTEHTRNIGMMFDIRIDYAPVGCPQYKARIERWHRTMAEEVEHTVPGATPPADDNGFRRDKDGRAYITFSAFVRRLWFWVAMVYARRRHSTLNDTPFNVWNEGLTRRLPRPLAKKDDLDLLLHRVELLTPSNKGVRWCHLRWKGTAIRNILSHPSYRKGDKVKVRIDDNDVSRAWVIDPVTRVPHLLEPVRESMKGLSLYRHRMALLLADEQFDGARDEETLEDAYAALADEADELLRGNTGKKAKAILAVGKHQGVGAKAPAGADHGSVLAMHDYQDDTAQQAPTPVAELVTTNTDLPPPDKRPRVRNIRKDNQ